MTFYSQKMISIKTQYEIYIDELLATIDVSKTWQHYLKSCKYEVFILTDNNNLYHFINIKSRSSRQVWWIQQLLKYHFQIDCH